MLCSGYMGGSGRVISLTSLTYESPSTVRLNSTCKHAPLQSIAPQLGACAPFTPAQQQQQQQPASLALPKVASDGETRWCIYVKDRQQQHQVVQPTAFVSYPPGTHTQQLQQFLPPVRHNNDLDACTDDCAFTNITVVKEQQSFQLVPHWQVVTCSAADLLSTAAQHASQSGLVQDEAVGPLHPAQLNTAAKTSKKANVPQTQQAAVLSAQPPALRRLISVAKHKQAVRASDVRKLLQQVQDLFADLPLYQLAYAAWAAGELAQLTFPSKDWLQQLLSAAGQHFQTPNSVTDESAVATLLQALLALNVSPGVEWMAACCASLRLSEWHTPRALSTLAACLPKLGFAPDVEWCDTYFGVTAVKLSAFPAVSAARMLHGVVGWRHLQQQEINNQQREQSGGEQSQEDWGLPEHWLLPLTQQLCAKSSQLKPPEIAMVLQAMQRLQQQLQRQGTAGALDQLRNVQLLPSPGQQPETPLQQACCQLLDALLAAVQQQLPAFRARDTTVMLFAVSSLLHNQQQQDSAKQSLPPVHWSWLQRTMSAVQVQMQQYDARGLATCLAAAAMLIKPHLHSIMEQQTSQPATKSLQPAQPQLGTSFTKPLQRWLYAQQQQQKSQPLTDPALAAAGSAYPATSAPRALGTTTTSSSNITSYWQQWLLSFYLHSHQLLSSFSCEDLTVSLCALASIKQVPPVEWYEQMLSAVQQQMPRMVPGQAAGIAWALGRMAVLPSRHNQAVSLVPSAKWMTGLYPLLAESREQQQAALTAGEAAAAGAGVAFPMRSCSAPELVRLMWASGVCDGDPGDVWWAAAEEQLLQLADENNSTSDSTSTSISSEGVSHSQHSSAVGSNAATAYSRSQQHGMGLSVQLLAMLVQAYAAAGRSIPATVSNQLFFSPLVLQQLHAAPEVSPIAALLKGLKQCRCTVPTVWLQQLSSGLQPRLAALSLHELLQLLDGLAGVGFVPQHHQPQQLVTIQDNTLYRPSIASVSSGGWAGICLQASHRHLPHLSASDLSFLLWTFVKLQIKPPVPWLEAALQCMQSGFLDAPFSSLGLFITAAARLGYLPSGDWLAGFMMATHRKAAAMAADPYTSKVVLVRSILMTLWAFSDLRVSPINHKWLKLMLLTVHQQLPLLHQQHCVALLQVLGRLQCRPSPRFLQSVLDHTGPCSCFSPRELVKVIFAAASLRWQPSKSWCQMYLAASAKQLASMNPQGLALVHWSLAVMKLMPTESWRDAAVAAVVSQMDQMNSQDLSMVVWAWGKMMVHITPRQESSRLPGRRQRRKWRQWLQERWHQQQQEERQAPQQQDWQRQWIQQQWQEWKQIQQQQGIQSPPRSSARTRLLQQRTGVADKLLATALALQGSYSQTSLVFLLVGVARLQLSPSQQWLQAMLMQGSSESLHTLNGVQLQQMAWALAKLGFRAPSEWLETMSLLLEVAWQENNFTRHSAAAALVRLQQLAATQYEHVLSSEGPQMSRLER